MNRPVTPESSRSTDSVVRDVRVPNRRMSPEWLSYGGQAGYTAFDIPHGDYRQEYMRTEPVTGPRRGRSQRNAPRNVVQAVEDTANRLHAMLQTRRNYDNRVEEILNQTHPEPRRTYGRSDHPRRRRRGWNDANRSQQQDNNNTNSTQRRSPNNNSPPVRAPTDNSPAAARGSPGSSGSRTSGTPPVTGRTSAREAACRAALNRQARSEVQRDQESNPPAARDSDRGNSESPGVRRAPTTRGQTDTASGEHTSQPAEQMDTQDVNGSAAIDSRDTNAQGSTSDSSPIVPPTAAPRESTFVLEATTNRDLPRDTQRRPVAFQVDLNTDDPSQSMRFEQNDYHRRGNRVRAVVGSRGSTDGLFTWPRGVACNPAHNTFVVADSSNHRCQVFDLQGNFRFSFGSYGQADGEFDCLAGVAVDPHGRIVIADRYNHRIQVFGYDGQFELSFGSEGRNPGELSYPWGVCCDNNARIYVCDKENHRIQVFEPDGRLINTFGSLGSGPGQLENPHYLAVTESRVIVSDSSNHRLQVFHIHGEFISSIGGEGSENGNFKHPRGVAVDSNGYVLVGDSGNNRVQVFRPDMTYYCDWGDWGSSPGQFKGIEGIAVGSRTRVCVSDRENHRVQVF